jgi:hypothetical protein
LPTGNLRSNSGAVLIVAAFAGHGLVYLPTYFVGDALQSGRLVTVLDDYMAPPLPLRALYPDNRYLSAKVRAFVDFVAARFGQDLRSLHQARISPRHRRRAAGHYVLIPRKHALSVRRTAISAMQPIIDG